MGKYFYKLSERFDKNKWLFSFAGIVIYYVGTFVGVTALSMLEEPFGIAFNWDTDVALGQMVLPFGLGGAYLFDDILKKQWGKPVIVAKYDIQHLGKYLQ